MGKGLVTAICKDLVSIISPAFAGYAVGKKMPIDPVLTSALIGGPLVVLSGIELLHARYSKKISGELLLPQNTELRMELMGKDKLNSEELCVLSASYSTNLLYDEAWRIIGKKTVGTGLSFGLGYLISQVT
jgi:hypothetical protein